MEAATDHFRTERVWCSLSFSVDLNALCQPDKGVGSVQKGWEPGVYGVCTVGEHRHRRDMMYLSG
jgi:hypothetical protein